MCELEGTLLKDPDPFSYFMLVAFEASGLIRFALLLLTWPLIALVGSIGGGSLAIRLMTFVAVAGVSEAEVEAVARAVLPKFMMDDVDMEAWRVFSTCGKKRVVVTRMPRLMVERFAKEHLRADEVVGTELWVTPFGLATGLVRAGGGLCERVAKVFQNQEPPCLGDDGDSFLRICKVS